MTATDDVEYVDFDEIAGDVADLLKVVGYGTDHTGAMLALVPVDAQGLAVDVADADPPSELHVTLGYIGESVLTIDAEEAARAAMRAAAGAAPGPVTATVTSIGELGDEGAVVLFLEPTAELTAIHDAVWAVLDRSGVEFPENFSPWKPHLTLGYAPTDAGRAELVAAGAPMVGSTIRFDQVALVISGAWSHEALGRPGLASATHRASLYAEFANPNHDRRGRFARRGEGRAVPTKGVDHSRVDLTKLDPDTEVVLDRKDLFPDEVLDDGTVYPPVRLGPVFKTNPPSTRGVFRAIDPNPRIFPDKFVYITEKGATRVTMGGDWYLNNDHARRDPDAIGPIPFVEASHAIDPTVSITFTSLDGYHGDGGLAWVKMDPPEPGIRERIYVSSRQQMLDDWSGFLRENPDHFMPAAGRVSMAEYVMTHEHGHVAHNRKTESKLGFPAVKGVGYIRSLLKNAIDEHNIPEQPGGGWRIEDLEPVRRGLGLSIYGMTSPLEAVAEAWTQRRLDPDNLSPECRRILKLARLA